MFPFPDPAHVGYNPYLRADWTELQLRFRPPRDSPDVSIRLLDYASPEEINSVIARYSCTGASSAHRRPSLGRRGAFYSRSRV